MQTNRVDAGAEHRRVMGHQNLLRAVGTDAASEIYVNAVRSGASIESTLAAYSKAAVAAGPSAVQRLQDTIDQNGYLAPTVQGLAGVPIGAAGIDEEENANRLLARIDAHPRGTAKRDLIDLAADAIGAPPDRGNDDAYANEVVREMEQRRGKRPPEQTRS